MMHKITCRVVASHLLLRRSKSILLLRRYKTGWGDGEYSVIAGHVDPGVSPGRGDAAGSLGRGRIRIQPSALEFAHIMHRQKPDGEEKVDVGGFRANSGTASLAMLSLTSVTISGGSRYPKLYLRT